MGQECWIHTGMTQINIRTKEGELVQVPDGTFVEVCDESDNIACLIYRMRDGTIKVVLPTDTQDVERYKNIFQVNFCPILVDATQKINTPTLK